MQTIRFPADTCDMAAAQGCIRLLAGIRAGGATLATFPKAREPSVVVHKSGSVSTSGFRRFVRRTVAGAAQIRLPHVERDILLLPV